MTKGFDRDVFKFIGDYIASFGETAQGGRIIKRSGEGEIGHWAGRAGGVGIENGDAIAHAAGSQGKHTAQLASADNAYGFAGRNHGRWRKSAIAKRAAAMAPLCPMGKVATGIPAGIWAMERRESSPRRDFPATGTPRTGRGVNAAAIPGR